MHIDLGNLRDSGHRSMTVSQGVFALCPGLFPALSFAQLCQNFVFLDLAIFTSLSLTAGSVPSLSFLVLPTCSLSFQKLPLLL